MPTTNFMMLCNKKYNDSITLRNNFVTLSEDVAIIILILHMLS